jgi:hypothetical protein
MLGLPLLGLLLFLLLLSALEAEVEAGMAVVWVIKIT